MLKKTNTAGRPEPHDTQESGQLKHIRFGHHGSAATLGEVERSFKDIFKDIDCNVRFSNTPDAKITELNEAYFQVLKNWDRRKLYHDKGFYILVISRQNNLSYELFLNSKSKNIQREKFRRTLEAIKEFQPSCKVFLGQNNPRKPVVPGNTETHLARYLKKIAEEIKVEIVDQFIMSTTECFSFEENHYLNETK